MAAEASAWPKTVGRATATRAAPEWRTTPTKRARSALPGTARNPPAKTRDQTRTWKTGKACRATPAADARLRLTERQVSRARSSGSFSRRPLGAGDNGDSAGSPVSVGAANLVGVGARVRRSHRNARRVGGKHARAPASAQAGNVSLRGGAQKAAWHLPARQIEPPSHGQLQPDPGGELANAAEKSDIYWPILFLLTASVWHRAQAGIVQEGTSPTATQSSSTMQIGRTSTRERCDMRQYQPRPARPRPAMSRTPIHRRRATR